MPPAAPSRRPALLAWCGRAVLLRRGRAAPAAAVGSQDALSPEVVTELSGSH